MLKAQSLKLGLTLEFAMAASIESGEPAFEPIRLWQPIPPTITLHSHPIRGDLRQLAAT